MFRQIIVLLSLITLGISTPVGLDARQSMCPRQAGVYDICDTNHSFLRCRGSRPMMVFDCAHSPEHYCQIQGDKGSCDGLRPPAMNGTLPHSLN